MRRQSNFNGLYTNAKSKSTANLGGFKGVDYTTPTFQVATNRAIDMANFIRNDIALDKRQGFTQIIESLNGNILNIWKFKDYVLVHKDSDLIIYSKDFKKVKEYLNCIENKSVSAFVRNDKFYVLSGRKFFYIDTDLNKVNAEDNAYIPTTTIGIQPSNLENENIFDLTRTTLEDFNNLSYYHANELTSGYGKTIYENDNERFVIERNKVLKFNLDTDFIPKNDNDLSKAKVIIEWFDPSENMEKMVLNLVLFDIQTTFPITPNIRIVEPYSNMESYSAINTLSSTTNFTILSKNAFIKCDSVLLDTELSAKLIVKDKNNVVIGSVDGAISIQDNVKKVSFDKINATINRNIEKKENIYLTYILNYSNVRTYEKTIQNTLNVKLGIEKNIIQNNIVYENLVSLDLMLTNLPIHINEKLFVDNKFFKIGTEDNYEKLRNNVSILTQLIIKHKSAFTPNISISYKKIEIKNNTCKDVLISANHCVLALEDNDIIGQIGSTTNGYEDVLGFMVALSYVFKNEKETCKNELGITYIEYKNNAIRVSSNSKKEICLYSIPNVDLGNVKAIIEDKEYDL